MKPYQDYKPSGVEWLGDVPSHWEVKKVKHLVERLVSGATPSTSDESFWDDANGTPWVAIGDMSGNESVITTARKVSAAGLRVKRMEVLPSGTVIYSMYASVGYASVLNIDAVTNQAIVGMFGAARLNNHFLMSYLNSIRAGVLQEAASNTQDNLNAEKVRNIPLLCPPDAEQVAIAEYLEMEVARIDELILEKNDLITLLEEHRQGVSSDAVMRGVNKEVTLKNVGRGFGFIPAHWRMIPLKRFVKITGGHTPSTDNPAYWTGTMPWVSPKDMKLLELSDSIDHISEDAVSECGLTVVVPGTTLVVVRGMILAHSFPVSRNLVPVTINQDLKAIQPVSEVLPEYLPWMLRGLAPVILSLTEQSAHGTLALRTDKFFGEAFPVPPLNEQLSIIEYLESELQNIDNLIAHTNDEIALLKDLRDATIADAVLGRIDVRTIKK